MTGAEVASEWLPAGEEAEPPGSITHCKILRNDGISSVSLPSGDIDAGIEPVTGIYCRDTRYVSHLLVSLGGLAPRLLDAKLLPHALTSVYTNPPLVLPDGAFLAGQHLVVRRRRVIDHSVFEQLTISNYSAQHVNVPIRISIGADFRDIFEVRGFQRHSPNPVVETLAEPDAITFRARGADGVQRSTVVHFSRPAVDVRPGEVAFTIPLAPQATERLEIEICVDGQRSGEDGAAAARRVRAAQEEWLAAITGIETDNERLNDAITQALVDIHSLRSAAGEHEYVAAGVPWFDTLFGRDSLIAGIELAPVAPEILRNALLALAAYQAESANEERDAEPGKIPHELRWGELARSGEVPFGAYYGSVDGTPLFLMAAAEYLRWTDDVVTIIALREVLDRAVGWCERAGEQGNGFLAYARRSRNGLDHQGWKDSHNGIVWPDGRDVEPPIALVEVQAYHAAALAAYAYLLDRTGAQDVALRARQRAHELVGRIQESFGHPDLGYVLCLDGEGRPVPTPASNSGHVLWAGAASAGHAAAIAHTLLGEGLFSGWGVRTLSAAVPVYNPLGYHTGSVWPHDNALILAGLRRYGFDAEAEQLGSSLVQLFLNLQDYQVPELLSGDARDLRLVPTPYPVSSRPQAWSAAAVPYVLFSLLGIRPMAGGRISVTRPLLPDGVHWMRLRGLRRQNGSADLVFSRHGGQVAVEVEHIDGNLEVVLSRAFPDPLLGAEG